MDGQSRPGNSSGYIFRGYTDPPKPRSKSEWVYGDAVTIHDQTYIICPDKDGARIFAVDPASIGRQTGLMDFLWTPIYENDLIRRRDGHTFVIRYADCFGGFALAEPETPEILAPGLSKGKDFIIIGNTTTGADANPSIFEEYFLGNCL